MAIHLKIVMDCHASLAMTKLGVWFFESDLAHLVKDLILLAVTKWTPQQVRGDKWESARARMRKKVVTKM